MVSRYLHANLGELRLLLVLLVLVLDVRRLLIQTTATDADLSHVDVGVLLEVERDYVDELLVYLRDSLLQLVLALNQPSTELSHIR